MQFDAAINIMNTLKDIHYYLQNKVNERRKKSFRKNNMLHSLDLNIESINSPCISYGLIGSTFTDKVENSGVRVQKDKSILNP